MNIETLYDQFEYELRGIYYVEKRLAEKLPGLADNATVDSLDEIVPTEFLETVSETFSEHGRETQEQIDRLERVFDSLPAQPETRERRVPTVDALIEEIEQFDHVILNDTLRTPFYIDLAMKVEQLEVKTYENLIRIADALDLSSDIVDPIEENLNEERTMLSTLEELSTGQQIRTILDTMGEEDPMT